MESKFSIHYEDENFLIAEKPVGIPVHPTKDPKRDSLEKYVIEYCKCRNFDNAKTFLRTVNRLDLVTSGIVVFLKNPNLNREADEWMKKSEKFYLAFVHGDFRNEILEHKNHLKEVRGKMQSVRSGGDVAITRFRKLEYSPELNSSLLLIKLVTGRRHQIRHHSAELGFPILGDTLYNPLTPTAFEKTLKEMDAILLHSAFLRLPISEKTIEVFSNPPEHFPKLEYSKTLNHLDF